MLTDRRSFVLVALVVLVVLIAACSRAPGSGSPASTTGPARSRVSAEIAPSGHDGVAFRPDGDGFRAAGTVDVRVAPSGRFRVAAAAGVELALETADIGERASATRARLSSDGTLAFERGAATELLRPQGDGVEQAWRFVSRPHVGADGNLVVRVRVEGMRFAAATAGGLHFAGREGTPGMHYGQGLWIDARGEQTRVTPRFEDGTEGALQGTIVLTVPAAVVASSTYPAVLDPIVSPEYDFDQPVTGPLPSNATGSASAYDGTRFFTVWSDDRADAPGIYGARVEADGTVLDPAGIRILGSASGLPAVGFDGIDFMVFTYGGVVRVDTGGTVLDTAGPRPVAGGPVMAPNMACAPGTGCLATWVAYGTMNGTTGYQVYAARISAAGDALDLGGIYIGATSFEASYGRTAVAYDEASGNYWVAFVSETSFGARARRVAASDGKLGPTIQIAGGLGAESLACTGGTCALAWGPSGAPSCDDCAGGPSGVAVARFRSSDGVVLGKTALDVNGGRPSVAAAGQDFLVAWDHGNSSTLVNATHVRASDGVVLDMPALALGTSAASTTPQHDAFVASGSAGAIVTFQRSRAYAKVWGNVVSAGAAKTPDFLVSTVTGPNGEATPAIAWDGTSFLAAWVDSRSGDFQIMGARIGQDGSALDSPAFVVGGGPGSKSRPRIAFDGTNYLVVWSDGGRVRGARVSPDGVVLDATPLSLPVPSNGGSIFSGAPRAPEVAFDGINYLVAWTSWGTGPAYFYSQTLGVRIRPDGTFVDAAPFMIDGNDNTGLSDLVFGAGVYLAVMNGPSASSEFVARGVLVRPDGTIARHDFPIGDGIGEDPSAASDGTNFLVVGNIGSLGLYGTRLASDGTVLDTPFPIGATSGTQLSPRAAFDGKSFFVAWEATRAGGAIYGARVAPDGTVRDADGIAIAIDQGARDVAPIVARAGAARVLVAYERDPAQRVHARFVDDVDLSLALGEACVSSADCVSGHCADGVCCNVACKGACEVCSAAGTCGPVMTPVPGNRPVCRADRSVCGGSCNGTSPDCSYPPTTTSCRAATCTSGVATPAGTCNGKGICSPVPSTPCAPYACGANECKKACTTDPDCNASSFCDGTSCTAKKAAGTCTRAAECTTGYCADGVCCGSACTDVCSACNVLGRVGTCSPAAAGAPLGTRACAGTGTPCAGSCDGAHTDACVYPGTSRTCSTPSCTNGIAKLAAVCDGAGACREAVTVDCTPFVCGATACHGDCSDDTDCVASAWCAAGRCTPRASPGAACSDARQCASGHCVDGVCCDAACDGACAVCNAAGHVGTCSPAGTGAPRAGRPPCGGAGACAGACDGEHLDCAYAGPAVTCGDALCANAVRTDPPRCDGKGACAAPTSRRCDPYRCAGSACLEKCASNNDCVAPAVCFGGVCSTNVADGGSPDGARPADETVLGSGGCACRATPKRDDGAGPGALALAVAALGVRRARRLLRRPVNVLLRAG